MIKVESINGSPSATPTEFVSSHFDGEYFYFFESEQEQIDFFAALPVVWSKEQHLAEINALHEAEYKRRLEAANYVNGWEVVACASDPTNEYYEEAKTLLAYWFDGWNAIETYGATVTEQTAKDPQTFVNEL
jgi:hypothetical protein